MESFYEFIRILIFLLFYFCLLILIYKQDESLLIIIKNINICVLIFSAIGLIQFIPHLRNYFQLGKIIDMKLAFSSALSNKNFYAETILMALPFIVYGIFRLKKFWKGISIFNSIIIFITILFLQTVSAWLGIFISLLLIAFFYKRRIFENKKIRIITLVVIVVAVLTSTVAIYSHNFFFKAIESRMNIALNYINHPGEMEKYSTANDNSTYERIILWKNSMKMIREHPFSGVGLGEWKIYFPKYGMGMAPYMNSGMIRFEKPHNDFLLVCCETGLPGLICYIALFIIAFGYCNKIIKQTTNEKDKLLFRLMIAALAGCLAISFFGYPNQRPFTMIFLMLIFAVIQSKYIQLFPPKENFKAKKIYSFLFISGIIISLYALNIGVKRLKAEMYLSDALRSQKYKAWSRMNRQANLAESSFFPMDYTSTPVHWYKGFANFYAGNYEPALINFQKAEKINPYHFNLLNDLGTAYDLQGNHEMAKQYYLKANQIAPLFPDALINLSVIYYNAGNIDSAYALISRDNLERNPNYLKDLKAILNAKAQNIVQQLPDSALRMTLSQKINDEKWLYSVFQEAKKTNDKLENVLLKNASH